MQEPRRNLVVVGNGLVGHKLLELLVEAGLLREWSVTTFCEEPRVAYDRVNLSGFFSGKSAAQLSVVPEGFYQQNGIAVQVAGLSACLHWFGNQPRPFEKPLRRSG